MSNSWQPPNGLLFTKCHALNHSLQSFYHKQCICPSRGLWQGLGRRHCHWLCSVKHWASSLLMTLPFVTLSWRILPTSHQHYIFSCRLSSISFHGVHKLNTLSAAPCFPPYTLTWEISLKSNLLNYHSATDDSQSDSPFLTWPPSYRPRSQQLTKVKIIIIIETSICSMP